MTKRTAIATFATLALLAAVAPPAATASDRPRADAAPAKDCTRLNGRVGYYGNPWCTPQEQRRWDIYESRRLRLGRSGS